MNSVSKARDKYNTDIASLLSNIRRMRYYAIYND